MRWKISMTLIIHIKPLVSATRAPTIDDHTPQTSYHGLNSTVLWNNKSVIIHLYDRVVLIRGEAVVHRRWGRMPTTCGCDTRIRDQRPRDDEGLHGIFTWNPTTTREPKYSRCSPHARRMFHMQAQHGVPRPSNALASTAAIYVRFGRVRAQGLLGFTA